MMHKKNDDWLKDYCFYTKGESKELAELQNSFKQLRLGCLIRDLVKKEDVDGMQCLLNGDIDFFKSLDIMDVLAKEVESISCSLFKCRGEIDVIIGTNNKKFIFIKEFFVNSLVKNINSNILNGVYNKVDTFNVELINIATIFLINNPNYIHYFKSLPIHEFSQLIKNIELNNMLSENLKNKNSIKEIVKI